VKEDVSTALLYSTTDYETKINGFEIALLYYISIVYPVEVLDIDIDFHELYCIVSYYLCKLYKEK